MMTSKEALEEIIEYIKHKRKDDHIPFFLQWYIDDIKKDLDRLEKLEKVIEILKDIFEIQSVYEDECGGRSYAIDCLDTFYIIKNKEQYDLLKEYLDDK